MDLPWILTFVIILAIILLAIIFLKKGKREKLTPLASISFILIIAGVASGDSRIFAYSLFGAGIILAIIDIILNNKKKK